MNTKYPHCSKLGLVGTNRQGNLVFNEYKFCSMHDYNTLRAFEDSSSFATPWNVPEERKLAEVEKFLANKSTGGRDDD